MCSHSGPHVRFSFALIVNSRNVHRPKIPKKGRVVGGGGGVVYHDVSVCTSLKISGDRNIKWHSQLL